MKSESIESNFDIKNDSPYLVLVVEQRVAPYKCLGRN